jgi:MscS family membrane protein
LGGILFWLIFRWGRCWDEGQPEGRVWRRFGRLFAALAGLVIPYAIGLFLADQLGITGTVRRVVSFIMEIVIFISFAWLVVLLLEHVAQAVIRANSTRLSTLDKQVVRIVFRIVSFSIVFYMLLKMSEHFGVPLTPLLAGLGVGGVAVALAARSTLENIIGGFILFADRPLKVGDFCRFGDKIGTVEEIGLRSTRVRSQERTIITVPNAEFANLQLENLTKRDAILLRKTLKLRYETTPDQLRFILAKLRELLLAHPKVTPEPARVRFIGFGEHSLDLEVFAYVETTDWGEYLAICEDIFLSMMDIIEQAGSDLAIPAQVHYVAQDEGVDAERSRVAENEVERWRAQGKLPFPQFEPAEREQIENKLDYPPKGSLDVKK